MPNSCNSITKIISIYFLVFLASCSSISQSTFSEKRFEGKLNLTQNKTSSNFIVKIKVFPEEVIIQIGKPLFGNLMKIKFNASIGLSFDPKIDDQYLAFYQNYNTQDYLYFFDTCFNNLNPNQNIFILNKNRVELKCEYKNKKSFSIFFRSGDELYINGTLKRE
jgi:hypothetical protein